MTAADALQQSLAGDLFTFLVVLTLLTWAIATATWWIRKRRTARRTARHTCHCQIGDCTQPAVATYDKHPSGTIRVCASHDQRIQRMAPATQAVYDQQSDLALWEREVGS